jgi:rhodanese-related sulfurtransferase
MKRFTTLFSPMKIINKSALQDLIKTKKGSYTLIDVRNPEETKVNLIETAHKVPLPEFTDAFSLTSDAFQKKYGFVKPSHEDHVIVYCRSGARATSASDILEKLGYKNVENYKGSASEWFGQ